MKNMVLIAGLATTMALGGLSAVEASSHKGESLTAACR